MKDVTPARGVHRADASVRVVLRVITVAAALRDLCDLQLGVPATLELTAVRPGVPEVLRIDWFTTWVDQQVMLCLCFARQIEPGEMMRVLGAIPETIETQTLLEAALESRSE